MESTWHRLQTNQRGLVKRSMERSLQNGGLVDSNESSVLSFDFVTYIPVKLRQQQGESLSFISERKSVTVRDTISIF